MYCRVRQETIEDDRKCLSCWNRGQKRRWVRRQTEQYGRHKRIARRECRLVNLFVKAADCIPIRIEETMPVPKEEILE